MKIRLFLLALCLLLPLGTASAQSVETIDNYQVTIAVNPDATLNVTERIDYDFGAGFKHGITREIPYKYQARGGNYNLRVSGLSVDDGQGSSYPVKISYPGNKESIRIGDANRTVTGKQTYVLHYTVARAINSFSDHDEIYWNAIGGEWSAPILSSGVRVILPAGAEGKTQTACFTGAFGSTEQDCSFSQKNNEVDIAPNGILGGGNGLTAVIGLPKGLIQLPTALKRTVWLLEDNWILFLPVVAFAIMFAIWRSRGRDPKSKNPIVAQYQAPEGLTPAEMGYLISERNSNRDVSAEIIYLAERGYLEISRLETKSLFGFKKTDFRLTKTKDERDLNNAFDRELMRALFASSVSDLSQAMPEDPELRSRALAVVTVSELSKTRNLRASLGLAKIPEKLVADGYFPSNPDKVKRNYMLGGIAVLLLTAWLHGSLSVYTVLSLILTGGIVLFFGFFMPTRTMKGADTRQLCLGLKEYLSVAEKDRLEFHNDPDKNPKVFEELLPYAIALGVTDQWARKFEGIYNQPPRWYHDPSSPAFNPLVMGMFINDFSGSMNSSLVSSGQRGGGSSAWGGGSGFSGGFSGGGFGGGGGGSW
ncbi:MAG: DUF2207 domain-containing protein [Candidatus Saccharibacteria bacterium]